MYAFCFEDVVTCEWKCEMWRIPRSSTARVEMPVCGEASRIGLCLVAKKRQKMFLNFVGKSQESVKPPVSSSQPRAA